MATGRVLLAGLLTVAVGCAKSADPGSGRAPIKVLAAASTRRALEEIASEFTATTGVPVECEFNASSTLARQIEHGAAADLFLSADEEWADYLEKKGCVDSSQPLLTNRLVIVVPTDSALQISELAEMAGAGVKRLAIAGESVPAGRYARQALRKAKVLGNVETRLLEGKDVTAVLLYVARGEADAGFVYATDATGNDKVRVVYQVSPTDTVSIRYPLVHVRQDRPNPNAARFAEYLTSESASTRFRKAGFGIAS
jgi:molybdate transport system substrate-binding protein